MRTLFVCCFVACAAVATAQDIPIQNGRVDARPALTIERAVETLGNGPNAVWIAWRVPMTAGDRDLCSTWSDDRSTVRGMALEPIDSGRPSVQPSGGPVVLEAASTLVIFARASGGDIERLRLVSAACPVDAGGQTVYTLSVSPADSIRALDVLARGTIPGVNSLRRVAESAISAIALHRDSGADAVLERLATDADPSLRQRALSELGASRGDHGAAVLTSRLATEQNRDARRALIVALASSPAPKVTPMLLDLAKTEPDARPRGEAAYRYVRRVGASKAADVLALLNSETDDGVRRRIVSGIAGWPESESIPVLIDLTKANPNLTVRKEAASTLSRSRDARAVAYLESVLR
jgi:HEAT repeat protein